MKRRNKRTVAAGLAVGLALSVAGCASATNASNTTQSNNTTNTTNTAVAAAAPVSSSSASNSAAPAPKFTTSQKNAIAAGKDYLSTMAFSKKGLIQQLSSKAGDGYPLHDAKVAVDSLHADWNAQAVSSAKEYLSTSSFSCADLTQQLSSSAGEGFTSEQAHFAAKKVGLC